MNDFIEKYSENANNFKSSLNVSGRFSFQKYSMKKIAPDIINKLELKPEDSLLDIGCNCGDLTIPISFFCNDVTVVDGQGAINRIRERTEDYDNFDYIVGDFLEVSIEKKFDCILAYSVLIYVDDFERKKIFIDKAMNMLKPGGRLLIGDVKNVSKKNRFEITELGKKIDEEYRKSRLSLTEEDILKEQFTSEIKNTLSDKQLMEILLWARTQGYESYLLPQSYELPFGYTRDDILIKKW